MKKSHPFELKWVSKFVLFINNYLYLIFKLSLIPAFNEFKELQTGTLVI
jgi:hypothetical protein